MERVSASDQSQVGGGGRRASRQPNFPWDLAYRFGGWREPLIEQPRWR